MKKTPNQPIIFFDGVCNLCNSSVQFVIKHDTQKKFTFASLQSDAAKEILLQFGEKNYQLDSIILIDSNEMYSKSSAVLRVLKLLGGFYSLLYLFIIIPKPFRDWLYNYVARNRYKWYGKRESCMIPSEKLKNRFLD